MNTALRHWREAATLIVAAGRAPPGGAHLKHPPGGSHLPPPGGSHLPPPGGSHLSIPGGSHLSPPGASHLHQPFDYEVLMLQRSSRSGFMPNAYVFPGGLVDPSDFSGEWLDVFGEGPPLFGLRGVRQAPETRPPIFATDRVKLGSPIPGEVAFRICALRETFEESGVLIAVPQEEGPRSTHLCSAHQVPDEVPDICRSELSRWRTLVNEDPSNFVRMCKELQVLPNIWALHEWSNWLTPAGRYGVSRFDTAFFICCLRQTPHALHDQKEIVKFQWSSPSDVLRSFQAQRLWIAPPQFYELSRVRQLPRLADLCSFASRRGAEGCEHWLPVLSRDEHNRTLSLLPGDELYPADASGESGGARSSDQLNVQDSGLHRMMLLGSHTVNLEVTITPKYNHLVPVTGQVSSDGPHSQL